MHDTTVSDTVSDAQEQQTAGVPPEATEAEAAEGAGPTSSLTDQYVETWLGRITTGLRDVEFGARIDDLAMVLALDANLTATGLDMISCRVSQHLKALNYRPFTLAQWKRKVADAQQALKNARGQKHASSSTQERYVALSRQAPAEPDTEPRCGVWDREANRLVLNVEPFLTEHRELLDEQGSEHLFVGRVVLPGGHEVPWRIRTVDYVRDQTLQEALYNAYGPSLQLKLKPAELRNAIGAISGVQVQRRQTTRFGWNEDHSAFLVPSGCITAAGFTCAEPADELRVDLAGCGKAAYLDLHPLETDEVSRTKRHMVADLLQLHKRSVTHALLGSAAAAVLQPLSGQTQRFALWLLGESGSGKTTAAALFANLFGDFPPDNVSDGSRFMSWGATPYAIESAGFYYRNSIFLVDDFKAGLSQSRQIIALVQRYADGTGRDRLRADTTFNQARAIRGLMVVTAENRLDNQASSTARTIIVPVPTRPTGTEPALQRCRDTRRNYPGVMADFIAWVLRRGESARFARRVARFRGMLQAKVRDQANADRIAGNGAVLAAAYLLFARYLAETCPQLLSEIQAFLRDDLPALIVSMAGEVQAQRPIEVFWDTLCELYQSGRVRIDRDFGHEPGRVIGRPLPGRSTAGVCYLFPAMAVEAVQESLRGQGRDLLPLEASQIARLLRAEGRLVDQSGCPLPATGGGSATYPQRIPGSKPARSVCVLVSDLQGPPVLRPHPGAGPASTPVPPQAPAPVAPAKPTAVTPAMTA